MIAISVFNKPKLLVKFDAFCYLDAVCNFLYAKKNIYGIVRPVRAPGL